MFTYLPAALLVAVASAAQANEAVVYEGFGASLEDQDWTKVATTKLRYTFKKSEISDEPGVTMTQEATFQYTKGDIESAGHQAGVSSCS